MAHPREAQQQREDPHPDGLRSGAGQARRLRELEALYAISAAVHASLEPEEVLRHAVHQVLEVLELPAGVLRVLDPAAGELVLAAHAGFSPEAEAELPRSLRIGEAPGGLAARDRSIVVVPDMTADGYGDSDWARRGYRGFISAPLLYRGMLLGSLTLLFDDCRPLRDPDRELLGALVNVISMAVANAELYAGAQLKIAQLSALHQCSRDMGPSVRLDEVQSLTCRRMAQLLKLDRVALALLAPETGELAGAAAVGLTEEALRALRAPLDHLPGAGAMLREAQSLLSRDPAGEGLLTPEFVRLSGCAEVLAVPLRDQQGVVGLLVGDRAGQPLRLTADENDLAMIFANQASVWIARARALAAATAAQAKFRDLLELAPDAIVLVDQEGRIGLVNGQAERMFGYTREELTGRPVELLMPSRTRREHEAHRRHYLSEPRTRPMGVNLDLYARRQDGAEFPVEISLSPIQGDDGLLVIGVIRDVTERKRSDAALREITSLQRAILDGANYAILSTDRDGIVRTFNITAQRWLGYAEEEVVGRLTPLQWHDPEEVARRAEELSRRLGTRIEPGFQVFAAATADGRPDESEWTLVRRDGSRFPVLLSATALRDSDGAVTGYLGVISDITARRQAEAERAQLLASEREKGEQLKLAIRETHHRIKNNLQAISDLLYLELASGTGGRGEDFLRDSVERIQSIALVHDLLSQDEDVQTVDARALAERIVPVALRAGGVAREGVQLQISVPSLALSSKKATNLALILNELVSNAVKHAFSGRPPGRLQVRLRQAEEGLVLRVEDDGPGLPAGFDLSRDASVGLQVVRTLAERDLGGKLRLSTGPGLAAEVWFPW